jgi:hypothetical protein
MLSVHVHISFERWVRLGRQQFSLPTASGQLPRLWTWEVGQVRRAREGRRKKRERREERKGREKREA